MTTVKVTELNVRRTKDGVSYGPFKASKDAPYLEVPEGIALTTGAVLYDKKASRATAVTAEPEPASQDDGKITPKVTVKAAPKTAASK